MGSHSEAAARHLLCAHLDFRHPIHLQPRSRQTRRAILDSRAPRSEISTTTATALGCRNGRPSDTQVTTGPTTPQQRRQVPPWVVTVITVGAVALTGIGLSSTSILFPELRRAFPDSSAGTLSWTANAFTIVSAATLIPAGALADRTGRKRMVLIGIALYVVGSAIGAVAPNPSWIIVCRTVQSLGSSAYTPATAALLMASFPPERLPAAIGIWAVTGGITSAIGPPISGGLLQIGDWRLTFWFNVPFGIIIFVAAAIFLTESTRDKQTRRP